MTEGTETMYLCSGCIIRHGTALYGDKNQTEYHLGEHLDYESRRENGIRNGYTASLSHELRKPGYLPGIEVTEIPGLEGLVAIYAKNHTKED